MIWTDSQRMYACIEHYPSIAMFLTWNQKQKFATQFAPHTLLPLARASEALERLDERLDHSTAGKGLLERLHIADAHAYCGSMASWLKSKI
ncbi:hypothetical protein RI570_19875 [Brucella pseudogrignonensis]|uniref:hypothetical protein n=1 Tax=Brucella pseudogrignonensis TaxID=419475 RepID=UPI0028B3D5DE|nr:hypothetical protein [Brucella pseudogrignonensis]MDT6942334.1 hypothetical protein [Brucella pseudogrignonensis]